MDRQSVLTNFNSLDSVEDDDLEGIGRCAAQTFSVQGGTTDEFLLFLHKAEANTVAEVARLYPGAVVEQQHLVMMRRGAMKEWLRIQSAPRSHKGAN